MDPNANLTEQLQLAERIADDGGQRAHDPIRLAELVLAMHQWIMAGGFLPAPWAAVRANIERRPEDVPVLRRCPYCTKPVPSGYITCGASECQEAASREVGR